MKRFKKNCTSGSETIFARVSNYLENRQRKIANYLNRKARNLSDMAILYCLIFFSLVMGTYLLYLIVSAFD